MGRSEETQAVSFWGLTGGIASGKSTVARFFSDLGIPIVDADQIARSLASPGGAAHDRIVKKFGTSDREKLRAVVFKDPQARKELEAILHPLIAKESQAQMQLLANELGAAIVLYEAALLVETGRYKDFSGLIVVESPSALRVKRLMDRDHLTEDLAHQMIDAQSTDEQKRKAATILIQNSGTLEELRRKVHQIALAAHWISK